MNIMNNLQKTFNKTKLQVIKHSPEILVVTGVVGTVVSAIMACKATNKLAPILDDAKASIAEIHDFVDSPQAIEAGYTPEKANKDLAQTYAMTGLRLAKLYGPSVILGTLSITGILTSNGIHRKRNTALAAAYIAVDKGFKAYRGNVVDRFGEALDRELKYGIKTEEVKETIVDENGKKKTVKKTVQVADPTKIYSDYARFFDDGCIGWEKDSEYNLVFLRHVQNQANDVLDKQGYLFLNDVYEMLGFQRTRAGQVVGWVKGASNGDGYVDFGIYDLNKPGSADFVNGYERTIILDFNVDGPILDMIDEL